MLLSNAAVPPAVGDRLPVLREVFVKEDDDSKPGEPVDDAAEASSRLVHHQLDVQQYQMSACAPDGPKSLPEVGRFVHLAAFSALGQDPAQGLPHVRASIRYHHSVVCLVSRLSHHACPSGPSISGPFGPVCGASGDFMLTLMNTYVGHRRTKEAAR